jgi:predicted transcriptional regulator
MAKKKAKRIPWSAIREKYITSETVTLDDLAKEFGVDRSGVAARSSKEKWTDKRRSYFDRVSTAAENLAANAEAKRRARMLTIADSMKALASEGLKRTIEDVRKDPKLRLDLSEIRLMLKDGTEIERRALGMADVLVMTDDELNSEILSIAARLAERGETDLPE